MKKKLNNKKLTGLSGGSLKTAQEFNENQILNSSRGHGFAGEKFNNLIDQLLLEDAKIVGANNLKKGPDRLVNGQYIQTKYCQTGRDSVSALFENGKYAYLNPDGSPMAAEIPREQFSDGITEM